MTPLKTKMEADLRLRNLAECTRYKYLRCTAVFARFCGCSPARVGTREVRAFLLDLADRGRAPATRAIYRAALHFLYVHTLGRPGVMAKIPRPRVTARPGRRPLTREEVVPLLAEKLKQ